jgi:4-amino-4-deoxy-L-arabinose transferase-like glycosyltransferase
VKDIARLPSREVITPAILTFLWIAAFAWMRPLSFPDEARYVGVAREMLQSGDWLTPTLNSLPFFHKPPLFYWITAAFMHVLGLNEWAARSASILGAWMGAMALYLFAQRWRGPRVAWWALVTLCIQPMFFVGGQFANLDMLVAGFITTTIVLAAHAVLSFEQGQPYRVNLAFAYVMAALGVLSKGLIGAALPALVIIAWLVSLRRWQVIPKLVSGAGIVLFLAIASPWFVVMQTRFPEFLDYFFVVQHFKRFTAGGFNNVQAFWFYPAILCVASLPWVPWFGKLLSGTYWADKQHRPIRILMVLWLVLVVTFFSIPQSKLVGYIFPALQPLAFLISDSFLSTDRPSARIRRWWWASTGSGAVLCVCAAVALSAYPQHSSRELAASLLAERSTEQPVIMLNHYYYDIPFYAKLKQPIRVVDDWADPNVFNRDNWRKELADAGKFLPKFSRQVLITPASLEKHLCEAKISWVVGATSAPETYLFLNGLPVQFAKGDSKLWRVDSTLPQTANRLQCEKIPNGDSASM